MARLVLLLLVAVSFGCGHDRIHEGNHEANFKRIFGEFPPAGVQVLNSVVAEYRWRLGVVSTDDWEFEIMAPRTWIEQQVQKLHLGPVGDNPFLVRHVSDRKARARPWYAPKPLDAYDAFYLTPTSIPYVHMLIEKARQPDGRYRVYLSKH
jgi:hypothetical protein